MLRKFSVIFLLSLILFVAPLASAESSAKLVDGQYITVEDGHLSYRGQRVRFWGINLCGYVKRSFDVMPLTFDRMQDVGFNALRLNLFDITFLEGQTADTWHLPVTVKGSGNRIDRLDHAVYLAKERGMFFWFSFDRHSRNLVPGDYNILPSDGHEAEWCDMAAKYPLKTLAYLDERAERVHQEYAKAILEHVNPYTGKRYADEETIALYEIFNENGFLEELVSTGFKGGVLGDIVKSKWNNWLTQRYKTTENLTKAWGKLGAGESLEAKNIEYAPILDGVAKMKAGYQRTFAAGSKDKNKFASVRGADVVRFAYYLYAGHTERFIKFVRSLGKDGKGIAVTPITATGCPSQCLAMYYGTACGDFVSNGAYGFACRPWVIDKKDPLYPFLARVNAHPTAEQPLDLMRVKDKPYLYYEVNDYKPNPYSVEFPMRIAMLASWQNADGVFWFNWDNNDYLPELSSDADYCKLALPMPDKNYPNAGLLLANDEVALAAIKSAGTIFRNGLVPAAANPETVVVGKDKLFNLAAPMKELRWPLRYNAWRSGIELVYDPSVTNTKLPKAPKEDESVKTTKLKMGPYVTFDWTDARGYIQVDSPCVRARVGFNGEEVTIRDTKISGVNRPFTSISFVSEDGLPLERSASVLVTMVAKNSNTGFTLDPARMKKKWSPGLAEAVTWGGRAPVITDRVSGFVKAPWMKGMTYEKYDFSRRLYARGTISSSLEVGKDEPMFYCRLTRPVKSKSK